MSKRVFSRLRGLRKRFLRRLLIAMMLLLQILLIVLMLTGVLRSPVLSALLHAFTVVTALHLLTRCEGAPFQLSLIFLLLLFPLFGGIFYWLLHAHTDTVGYRRRLAAADAKGRDALRVTESDYATASAVMPQQKPLMRYLTTFAAFPVCKNTETQYFSTGKEMLSALLDELKNAKRYIFLEYFIIEEGEMWGAILAVLRERAAAGVDVRVIYDDVGCLLTLPVDYPEVLRSYGIRCARFNPFRPFLSTVQNNRDHRKITVIDGKVAFTGGINLADEYINRKIKHGHWKDAAIRCRGDAAQSFSVMFLQMWEILVGEATPYDAYLPEVPYTPRSPWNGWVQVYADSPLDEENVSEHVYLQWIRQAQDYLYLTTPYLIVGESILSALKLTAKSGVDVRIITPHTPDKHWVHFTTRSYYRELIGAGVKIYEYSDGFIHAKNLVSDDCVASVGTTNLDFRSLYLQFECGVCLYRTDTVYEVKKDFLQTLQRCRCISLSECRASLVVRLLQNVCRLFAPLM